MNGQVRAHGGHTLMGAALLALVTAGCGQSGGVLSAPTATLQSATAPSLATSNGSFRFVAYGGENLLGGREVDFASLLGHGKPVVLNFWAGLCPPCRAEMPAFQRVYGEHRADMILVGVDVGVFTGLGSHTDGRRLLDELGITYAAGYAVDASPLRAYRVIAMPTTVFFARDGRVAATHIGYLDEGELRAQVAKLLEGP